MLIICIKSYYQNKREISVFTCFSGGGADKAIDKMKKYIGIEKFEAELILIDPKDKVKEEDDEKIVEFCSMLMQMENFTK